MTKPEVDGLRVLVVEDESMVAMLIEDLLGDLGCTVIGPAANVADALTIIGRDDCIDAALLDMSLGNKSCLPVADALADRGVPFAFASGYGAAAASDSRHAGVPVLSKPFKRAVFAAMVRRLAEQRRGPPADAGISL